MENNEIKVKFKKVLPDAKISTKGSRRAACFYLHAVGYTKLNAGQQAAIRTGIILDIPYGHEGLIRPRSTTFQERIEITLGTIDYVGEIKVLIRNRGNQPYIINPGDRIAQLKIQKVYNVVFIESDDIKTTERGTNGFGSTGK